MSHIHVKDKRTGHEYPVSERLFDEEKHEPTGKPAHDAHGDLVAMKPRRTVKQAAAAKKKTPAGAKSADSGQKAETEKE